MICLKCKKEKPETDFYWKIKAKGKRNRRCKECCTMSRNSKEHYKKYRSEYIERNKAGRARRRNAARKYLVEHLSKNPCSICGESDILVLEFDHRERSSKLFTISSAVSEGYKPEKLKAEIDKCDVLCANCHKRRTAKQFGWYKLKV